MSMIQIRNLTFAYDGSFENVYENVSFQLDTDWKLGFIGRNGCGKTTFLNLLRGKHDFSGSISADVSFDYFPPDVGDKTLSAGEVAKSLVGAHEDWRLRREMGLLRLDEALLYQPFDTLSHGEQTKLLLAVLFLRENGFLLIDEPTNHLDGPSRALVSNYLRSKKGFILVSHDRAFLDRCVDHVLSVNRMNIEIQKGNFSSWWKNKQRQDHFDRQRNEKLQKEIKRLSEATKRTADWSDRTEDAKYGTMNSGIKVDRGYVGRRAAKMMKRAKAIENRQQMALQEKEGLLQNIELQETLKITPRTCLRGNLVECRDLSLRYGEKTVADNIRFSIRTGDRIALRGKNGSGKTTLLHLICGEAVAFDGILERNSRLKVSYVPQDTNFLHGTLRDFAEARKIDESLFKAILRKLGLTRTQLDRELRDFSAGQKKKVLIAASLSEQADLYVWDEPLNYIDVFSRMQIEELLLACNPTLLFVEHDSAFCDRIATACVDLDNAGA